MSDGRRLYRPSSQIVLDQHVLALDVAGFVEALAERSDIARRGISRPTADKADDRHRRLLCTRRERPRGRRAADQCGPLWAYTRANARRIMTDIGNAIEQSRRRELTRDAKAALQQGLSLDEYIAKRDQTVTEWTRWFHAEMDKCHVDDPIECLPQAFARVEERAIGEARAAAKAAARTEVRAMLRKVITP
jgi:hypothetical protein